MQIPKRLQTIGDLIPNGANVADIGADHGLLEQYIALHKENCKVLAIENKEGPLEALRNSVECLNNVIVSHSDGMNQVSKEYDTVVLAGMGGDNIINILSKKPHKLNSVNQIIVDAHSFIPEVRRAIIGFGFDIDCEKIVYESSIYYVIISFTRNTSPKVYTQDEIEFGYKLYLDPLFESYKNHIIKGWEKIRKALENIDDQKQKYDDVSELIRRLESYGQN